MPESKTPDMERVKKRVLADYRNGKKPKELSEKYSLSVNTIKSWIRRADKPDEKKAGAKKSGKRVQPDAPKKPRGAPAKNSNAVGNSGGAPVGSANALIHGGYSPVYFDTLTNDEKALLTGDKLDPETLLQEEILLLSIRERRIMARIRDCADTKGGELLGQLLESVVRNEEKREFDKKKPEDKELYEAAQRAKIESGQLLPGHKYNVTTRTEAAHNVIHRLEEALTRCQAQKQRCIRNLMELQAAQLGQSEIEDLDSVEEAIYGADSGSRKDGQETPDNSV